VRLAPEINRHEESLPIWYNGVTENYQMITAQQQSLLEQSDALYERYGKPLEKLHRGKYVAISQEGKTLLGESVLQLIQEAKTTLGPENFIFKIGERAVGQWL
jgi:hypothetical protein